VNSTQKEKGGSEEMIITHKARRVKKGDYVTERGDEQPMKEWRKRKR